MPEPVRHITRSELLREDTPYREFGTRDEARKWVRTLQDRGWPDAKVVRLSIMLDGYPDLPPRLGWGVEEGEPYRPDWIVEQQRQAMYWARLVEAGSFVLYVAMAFAVLVGAAWVFASCMGVLRG